MLLNVLKSTTSKVARVLHCALRYVRTNFIVFYLTITIKALSIHQSTALRVNINQTDVTLPIFACFTLADP